MRGGARARLSSRDVTSEGDSMERTTPVGDARRVAGSLVLAAALAVGGMTAGVLGADEKGKQDESAAAAAGVVAAAPSAEEQQAREQEKRATGMLDEAKR